MLNSGVSASGKLMKGCWQSVFQQREENERLLVFQQREKLLLTVLRQRKGEKRNKCWTELFRE
jgi:hypothetical protein